MNFKRYKTQVANRRNGDMGVTMKETAGLASLMNPPADVSEADARGIGGQECFIQWSDAEPIAWLAVFGK